MSRPEWRRNLDAVCNAAETTGGMLAAQVRADLRAALAALDAAEKVVRAAERVVDSRLPIDKRCDSCRDITHLCAAVAEFRNGKGD